MKSATLIILAALTVALVALAISGWSPLSPYHYDFSPTWAIINGG